MLTTVAPLGSNIDGTGESRSTNSAILYVFRRFAPTGRSTPAVKKAVKKVGNVRKKVEKKLARKK
jgi:hypothetical protein